MSDDDVEALWRKSVRAANSAWEAESKIRYLSEQVRAWEQFAIRCRSEVVEVADIAWKHWEDADNSKQARETLSWLAVDCTVISKQD